MTDPGPSEQHDQQHDQQPSVPSNSTNDGSNSAEISGTPAAHPDDAAPKDSGPKDSSRDPGPSNRLRWEQIKHRSTDTSHLRAQSPPQSPSLASGGRGIRSRRQNRSSSRRRQFSCDDDHTEVLGDEAMAESEGRPTATASGSEPLEEHEEQSGDAGDTGNDASSVTSNESMTLRDRQDAINTAHPFGIRIWKPAIYKKIRSVEQNAEDDLHSRETTYVPWQVTVGNFFWSILFGIPLFVFTILSAAIVLILGGLNPVSRRYGKLLYDLAFFFLWPFGKYIQLVHNDHYRDEDAGDGRPIADYLEWHDGEPAQSRLFFAPRRRRPSELVPPRNRIFGRGQWSVARVIYFVVYYTVLTPLMMVFASLCWLSVFGVPMARVIVHLLHHLRVHPLALRIRPTSSFTEEELHNQSRYAIILCTYRAFGLKYYKYTVMGTNIILVNLMVFVFFVIFDFYTGQWLHEGARFFLSLLSIVPLAYFIGLAVASISAQSSMSMGATINAFFSTIVEVFLYVVALRQGKGEMVNGSIIGSIMAGVLLMPGLSMCAGAIKRKTQRFNPQSTGVTSTMLLFAIVGAVAPTLFYNIYGLSQIACDESSCGPHGCHCWTGKAALTAQDPMYLEIIRPLSALCVVCLFLAYICGLFFTLRTHAAMIWATGTIDEDDEAGHDAPNWGRLASYAILLGATWLYAIIAEILVDSVDFVLKHVKISEKLLGITIFALVPNTTEFLNAISFAMQGNVSLSLEIGSAYALQVCLLQIPALVIAGLFFTLPAKGPLHEHIFTMVFPQWDVWTSVFGIFMYNNVHAEGKSNYFKGSILLLSYLVLVAGYYFDDIVFEHRIGQAVYLPTQLAGQLKSHLTGQT